MHPRTQRSAIPALPDVWLNHAVCGDQEVRRGAISPLIATCRRRPCPVGEVLLDSTTSSCSAAHDRPPQFSMVTSVPIGVYGQTFAAEASGSSTQPRLCGAPNEARLKAWMASPPLK